MANSSLREGKFGGFMRELATQFDEGHYHYRQVERHGNTAIFEQQHKENPKVIRYEAVRIRVAPAHTWPDGSTSPEREVYPGSSRWGWDGFTCFTLMEAQEALAGLLEG